MKQKKRLFAPFLYILGCGLIAKVFYKIAVFSFAPILLTAFMALSLFVFGMLLNSKKKKAQVKLYRLTAIVISCFLALIQMGFINIPWINATFDFFAVDSFFIHMAYIYCGYMYVG